MEKIEYEYSTGNRQMFENHRHKEYEIYFLIKGQRYYFVNGQTHLVMPGNLVIIDSDLPHKVFSAGYGYFERHLFYVRKSFISESLPEDVASNLFSILSRDKFIYKLPSDSGIESILNEMKSENVSTIQDKKGKKTLVNLSKNLLYEMNDMLFDGEFIENDIGYVNKNILQITDYINRNYAEKITLDDIAEKFGLSKFYLCKLFKKSFGCTFTDFLNNVRIMEAKKLIASTDMKISQIAEETGYSDTTYFCRVFKKIKGQSALNYRKSKNANIANPAHKAPEI